MPPRKNKRKFDDEDQELDKAEKNSKWATLLKKNEEDQEEVDPADLYQKPKKEIFNFDFSKQHLLLNQKQPVRKQEPKIVLTPQEQQELDRRLAKQKKEKQEKEKIKKQKKFERKKVLQKEKQEEKQKKDEQQKQEEQLEKVFSSNKNKGGDTKYIFYTLLILFVVIGTLQYQKEIYVKLSKFRLDSDVNYYEVLQTTSGVTETQLKTQYKKLVLKYHPDKNPNCHTCKQKFQSIMQAWEVLGNLEKREHYDTNSGFINPIPSSSLTLNSENYYHLLSDSDDVWIIQVYDSTNQYCHYFARLWDDAVMNYKNIVKFGRIDVWQQSEMKSFIPYRFQIFPGLYSVQKGEEKLCQLDFERPMKSIQSCIQSRVKEAQFTKIRDWSEIHENTNKNAVIIGGGVKLGTRIKIIHSKFERYFDYYLMNNAQTLIKIKGTDFQFDFNVENSKKFYENYERFLQSSVIQARSMCEVQVNCKQAPCILLLEKGFKNEKLYRYPIIQVKQEQEFNHKIDILKNMTGLNEKFQLGLYQDGKLELGNFDQVDELNPQNGEVIDLTCVASTWVREIIKLVKKVIQPEA